MDKLFDNISRPAHYAFSVYEPKDVIRAWELNFNLGNVVKYVARAGRKGDKTEDLKKAKQYLDFELEALERRERMLANVRIEQDKDKPYNHKLEVNGVDFSNSTYSVEIESESIPEVNIKMRGAIPLYVAEQAKVNFNFSPTSIQDALFILILELQKHSDVYNGFLASIESSVREQKLCGLPFQPEHEIAEKILKRIIGED